MKHQELMDEPWALIDRLVPSSKASTGQPPRDRRHLLNGIFLILHTGASWRDLPARFGPWQIVYHHFAKWRREGVLAEIVEALPITLDQRGLIDWNLWCIDGANVRAAHAAAGANKKVSTGTPTNRRTTLWDAAEAGLDRSSTWLLTVAVLR